MEGRKREKERERERDGPQVHRHAQHQPREAEDYQPRILIPVWRFSSSSRL
jgi:hypothetical protein